MKKLTLISAVALSTISTLSAQTDVNVTGSTAYRANFYRAVQAILSPGYTVAYNGGTAGAGNGTQSALEGSNFAIFNGNLASNGHAVRIKTSFTGSEAGIQAVGKQTAIAFYPDSQTTGALADSAGAGTPVNTETAQVDMADTQQAASNFSGRYKGFTYPSLTENANSPLGVVPFKFYGTNGCTVGNVTAQQVRALYTGGGHLPLSFFTGNTGDSGVTVNATGRNPDSGTRVTLMAESGVGSRAVVNANQAPFANNTDDTNVANVITTANQPVDHFNLYPAGTVNTIAVSAGDNGYDSGGKLAAALNASSLPANTQFIGYASTNDGDGQLTSRSGHAGNGTVELAYNGQTLGFQGNPNTSSYDYNTNTNLTYGRYTYWGYEHMYMGSGATGDILNAANDVAGNLKSTNAIVLLTSMHAARGGFVDGATVQPQ